MLVLVCFLLSHAIHTYPHSFFCNLIVQSLYVAYNNSVTAHSQPFRMTMNSHTTRQATSPITLRVWFHAWNRSSQVLTTTRRIPTRAGGVTAASPAFWEGQGCLFWTSAGQLWWAGRKKFFGYENSHGQAQAAHFFYLFLFFLSSPLLLGILLPSSHPSSAIRTASVISVFHF